jgi:hypothetical protein
MSGVIVTMRVPRRTSYALEHRGIVSSMTIVNKGYKTERCTVICESADGTRSVVFNAAVQPKSTAFNIAQGFNASDYTLFPGDALWFDAAVSNMTLEYDVQIFPGLDAED